MNIETRKNTYYFFQGASLSLLLVVVYQATYFFLENQTFQKLFQNQTFLTVISGVTIFAIGQIIQDFILKPIYKHKEVIGKIEYQLNYFEADFENFYTLKSKKEITSITDETTKMKRYLKTSASDLVASYKVIPFRRLLAFTGTLVDGYGINLVSKYLMFIANQNDSYVTRAELKEMGLSNKEIRDWDKSTVESNLETIKLLRQRLRIHDYIIDSKL